MWELACMCSFFPKYLSCLDEQQCPISFARRVWPLLPPVCDMRLFPLILLSKSCNSALCCRIPALLLILWQGQVGNTEKVCPYLRSGLRYSEEKPDARRPLSVLAEHVGDSEYVGVSAGFTWPQPDTFAISGQQHPCKSGGLGKVHTDWQGNSLLQILRQVEQIDQCQQSFLLVNLFAL